MKGAAQARWPSTAPRPNAACQACPRPWPALPCGAFPSVRAKAASDRCQARALHPIAPAPPRLRRQARYRAAVGCPAIGETEHIRRTPQPRPGPRRAHCLVEHRQPVARRALRRVAIIAKASGSTSTSSAFATSAKWAASLSAGIRRRSNRWQRDSTVTGTLLTSSWRGRLHMLGRLFSVLSKP